MWVLPEGRTQNPCFPNPGWLLQPVSYCIKGANGRAFFFKRRQSSCSIFVKKQHKYLTPGFQTLNPNLIFKTIPSLPYLLSASCLACWLIWITFEGSEFFPGIVRVGYNSAVAPILGARCRYEKVGVAQHIKVEVVPMSLVEPGLEYFVLFFPAWSFDHW